MAMKGKELLVVEDSSDNEDGYKSTHEMGTPSKPSQWARSASPTKKASSSVRFEDIGALIHSIFSSHIDHDQLQIGNTPSSSKMGPSRSSKGKKAMSQCSIQGVDLSP